MGFLGSLSFIANHPLNRSGRIAAITRFARWQIATRVLDQLVALPFAGDTVLLTQRGMTGSTGNWYCGLHEVDEMGFVLHMLRGDDLFVDVGSNIGSFTVLAAGVVGAQVIAIEPLPVTFERLRLNVAINNLADQTELHRCGVSDKAGELRFTSGLDTMNRVALSGEDIAAVSVPVRTLDDICAGRVPRVLKIDVEGHERAVIDGAATTLSHPALEAVLLETNESGSRFGISDDDIVGRMIDHGFTMCSYDALARRLVQSVKGTHNTIFVRDPERAQRRCVEAATYTLVNGSI